VIHSQTTKRLLETDLTTVRYRSTVLGSVISSNLYGSDELNEGLILFLSSGAPSDLYTTIG
jgi:hypothetical protein